MLLDHHGAGALAVKVLVQPRVLRGLHVGDRSGCNDLPVAQHGDAVAGRIKAVEVVGYHENGQAQSALQGAHQLVEIAGADRIEAGGRLVQEHQFRIERERARQRHALDHAAGEVGRVAVRDFGFEAHHHEFGDHHLVEQFLRELEIFAHRKLDVLPHRERGKQRALLKQDAPAPLHAAALVGVRRIEIDAEYLDAARHLRHQADDGAGQYGFARAGRADEAEDLAALDVEVEPVEHAGFAELHGDVANPDDGVGSWLKRHGYIPIAAKKIANTPSITMTKKMPFTTDEVVCWPSDSALPCTASPSTQATMPMVAGITGALTMPTMK